MSLSISANNRYLLKNGQPLSCFGSSGWAIATTLALTGTNSATSYLTDQNTRGFNAIVVNLIDNQFNWGNTVNASTWGPNANSTHDLPFLFDQSSVAYTNAQTQQPDFSTPNSAYWNYVDSMLNLIATFGWTIFAYPIWIGNPVGGPGDEGFYNALSAQSSAIRQGYGAFIANRYGPGGTNPIANLIIVWGGDNYPDVSLSHAVVTDCIQGYRSVDSTTLLSVDGLDGSSMINEWGNSTAGGTAWLQVNTIYTDIKAGSGHPFVYQQCLSEYANTSGWKSIFPQFFKEGGYENGQAGVTQQLLRAQTWQAMFGGCFGFFFGNQPLWLFGSGWPATLGSAGMLAQQVAINFFNAPQRPFWLLNPDGIGGSFPFLTNGASQSGLSYISSAMASDGSWAGVYFQTTIVGTVDLSKFNAAVMAWWMDPVSGTVTRAIPSGGTGNSLANRGSFNFTPPGANSGGDTDWVLYFQTTDLTAPSLGMNH